MTTPNGVQFGIFPTPNAASFDEDLRLIRLADDIGLDLVGIQDHPYQRRFLDVFTLMSWALASTENIRVFPDVANLAMRAPAMIAKESASLDVMSRGRFELGLGAGSFYDAIAAMGGPRRSPGESFAAFEEAVDLIKLFWTAGRGLEYEGEHYSLSGVHGGPPPAHDIGIWVGAHGPRMLNLIGRKADGWVPSSSYIPPEKLGPMHARIDEGAAEAGRDPDEIRRIYNISGTIRPGPAQGFLIGDQQHWVTELTELVERYRMDSFILWLDEDAEGQVRALAEIATEIRAQLGLSD